MMDFNQLTKDICDRFLPVDPAAIVAGETFDVDGVPAAMHWDPYERPEYFTLILDFGGAPAARMQDIHTALLKRNFELVGNDAGMLALNPDNLHIVYAKTIELARAHALDVIDVLMGAVEEGKSWHREMQK